MERGRVVQLKITNGSRVEKKVHPTVQYWTGELNCHTPSQEMAPSKQTMTPEEAAEFPKGNGLLNTQYMDLQSEDDRDASDDKEPKSEEDDALLGDEMLECHPYGTSVLRITKKHCRGQCSLKQSDGLRATCICAHLASVCNKHTRSDKLPPGFTEKPNWDILNNPVPLVW